MIEPIRLEVKAPDAVPLAEADAQGMSVLAALADPVRWAVLKRLSAGAACVCEIQEHVTVPANALSYHLKVLREAGLVTQAKRGRFVDYSVAPDASRLAIEALPFADASLAERAL